MCCDSSVPFGATRSTLPAMRRSRGHVTTTLVALAAIALYRQTAMVSAQGATDGTQDDTDYIPVRRVNEDRSCTNDDGVCNKFHKDDNVLTPQFTAAALIELQTSMPTQQDALSTARELMDGAPMDDLSQERLELALMHLHHVSELSQFTDQAKTARQLADDVVDVLFGRMFANATTLEYDPTRKVFQAQRFRLAKVAKLNATVSSALPRDDTTKPEAEEAEMLALDETSARQHRQHRVEYVLSGRHSPRRSAALVVRGLATRTERARLVALHRAHVLRNHHAQPLYCSGEEDAGQFVSNIQVEATSSVLTLHNRPRPSRETIRNMAFIPGYDCLTSPSEHLWVAGLPVCAEETVHYTGEFKFLDAFHRRIEAVTGISSDHGGPMSIVTLRPGCGAESRTFCTPGGRYSPRKIHAATVLVALDNNNNNDDVRWQPCCPSGSRDVEIVGTVSIARGVCDCIVCRSGR
eukprot:m.100822 g.100822  ORF g.100822 m.100822 type:complete len:466 (-) comp10363_c0_seq1:333-1730(-)